MYKIQVRLSGQIEFINHSTWHSFTQALNAVALWNGEKGDRLRVVSMESGTILSFTYPENAQV